MYWPSTPANGDYVCQVFGGDWLDLDEILAQHPNWQDCTLLPTSSRESKTMEHALKH